MIVFVFFFFNDTATTEIYTLSLHDALPIYQQIALGKGEQDAWPCPLIPRRSEEHTSELQSLRHLVCRLLLEKKKKYLVHAFSTTNKKNHSNKYNIIQ